ncbi:unnamed protein product [Lymnaea stagnalis]|uniref:Uncharacterized protein n=1 Tax=Lymnaea stagnalis TaxID=6523 RepID=A0AAV2HEA1_LYMST
MDSNDTNVEENDQNELLEKLPLDVESPDDECNDNDMLKDVEAEEKSKENGHILSGEADDIARQNEPNQVNELEDVTGSGDSKEVETNQAIFTNEDKEDVDDDSGETHLRDINHDQHSQSSSVHISSYELPVESSEVHREQNAEILSENNVEKEDEPGVENNNIIKDEDEYKEMSSSPNEVTARANEGDTVETSQSPTITHPQENHNTQLDSSSDHELDDFFGTEKTNASKHHSQEGVSSTGESKKPRDHPYFPALDIVDLETDDEGQQDVNKDDAGGGDNPKASEEDLDDDQVEALPSDVAGHGTVTEPNTSIHIDGNGVDRRNPMMDSPRLTSKDYPLNYQNYKVCRELQPGVEECLILETGEQIVCFKDAKTTVTSSEVTLTRTGFLAQQECGSDHRVQDDTHDTAKNSLTEKAEFHTQMGWPAGVETDDVMENMSSESDSDHSEHVAQDRLLRSDQSFFITDKGVPIMMDYTEDDDAAVDLISRSRHQEGQRYQNTAWTRRAGHGSARKDEEFVGDVLCGEWKRGDDPLRAADREELVQPDGTQKHKIKKFFELQPDVSEESTEETALVSDVHSSNNNNNNGEEEHQEKDTSNNANYRHHGDDFHYVRETHRNGANFRAAQQMPERTYHSSTAYSSPTYGGHSHEHGVHCYVGSRLACSRNYNQALHRGSSYTDSRGNRSRGDSSYYRSANTSSGDTSRLSTRYTHIERGIPRQDAHESVTVPKFKTLHDQQVSWLDMFKMIEEQHKCDLQSQYQEHQKILQEMQRNMERELTKQQETLKKRLSSHREILEELSPRRHGEKVVSDLENINQSRRYDDEDSLNQEDHQDHHAGEHVNGSSSKTTLMGVPVSLRNPPPLTRYLQSYHERMSSDELPVKRSLEKELLSPSKPADTSLNLSRLSVGGDKQLRGGVYSSPMPIAKVKHKKSPRASKSYDDTHRSSPCEDVTRNSVHWAFDARTRPADEPAPHPRPVSSEQSLGDSDDVLSPRTRIGLREKHAKHLADLKAYYEEELREMRQMLMARQERGGGDGGLSGISAGEKILANENHELRQKCQEYQDVLHDAKVEIRELQQKIQGLEIRATDYAERYDTSQAQVLSLKSRLEEVTEFAREKESMAAEAELKLKKTAESLQMAYKKEKELTESLHSAKTTIQRLVDKYETLEKDYGLLKESLSATEQKLYSSRSEVMDANNHLSKAQLEIKHLRHDNEILKHDLAMARSSQTMKTSYEEAYSPTGHPNYGSPNKSRTRSADRSYPNPTRGRIESARSNSSSPVSDTDSGDHLRSPILRAEKELRNLQKSFSSQEFTPKLQRKFYGSEAVMGRGGLSSSTNAINNFAGHPSPDKPTRQHQSQVRHSGIVRPNDDGIPPSSRTPTRSSIKDVNPGSERYKDRPRRDQKGRTNNIPAKISGSENGVSGEQAIDRVRSGDIVSRPAWEDVYTSMTPGRSENGGGKMAALNSARDMMIRERLMNIDNLERKYDDLNREKRQYESALSKLPAQGHRGEKEKLEAELDRVDRELGSVRMSLKRFHVLKSTI